MKYFRFRGLLLSFGLLCLLQFQDTEGKKKKNRHRRHNHLDWSAWTEWTSCTAQCGTGTVYRERKCIDRRERAYSNKCHGNRHQFKVCNTQKCNPGQETLREQLCTKHNNDVIGGKRFRWLPYLLHSARCELTCKASGQGFYNSFPDLIVNGTTCTNDGSSVCVEGVCKKFGCDGIVGSDAVKDVCGVCDGDGSSCKMVQDVFEDDKLEYGYNLVTIIPSGATSINVTQLRPGRNYLALKLKSGKYVINGRRRLSSPGQYEAAGTTFTYRNRASNHCPGECFFADGPTSEDVEVMLLYFGRNTGILYKFGYPTDQNGMLKYQSLPSGNNGNSLQINNGHDRNREVDNYINNGYSRTTYDYNRNRNEKYNSVNSDYFTNVLGNRNRDTSSRNTYSDIYYNNNYDNRYQNSVYSQTNNQRPQETRDRQTQPQRNGHHNRVLPPTHRYDASVVIEESQSKLVDRGRPGERKEKSYYISSLSGGNSIPSPNRKKHMPAYTQSFPFVNKMKDKMHNSVEIGNGQNDPMYSGTAALGDNGRVPIVVSEPIDPQTIASFYNWKVTGYTACNKTCGSGIRYPIVKCFTYDREVPGAYCERLPRPNENAQDCNTHNCPASWEASPWTDCSTTCDDGIQIRNISCLKEVAESLFLETTLDDCSELKQPETYRTCRQRDCFSWNVSSWSQCSVPCGHGLRVRSVNCTSPDGFIVEDFYCNTTAMPLDEEGCYKSCKEVYKSTWYFTPWEDECPVDCGTGKQRRRVVCVSENPYGPDCEDAEKPEEEKDCRAPKGCHGYWFSGPWQQCNATCGEGMRKRQVVCLRKNGDTSYEVIPDTYCDMDDRPYEMEPCQSPTCPAEWFVTDWSECSATCGKGERSREVLCIDTDHREVDACNITTKPSSTEECGTTPCRSYGPQSGKEEEEEEEEESSESSSSDDSDVDGDCTDTYSHCNLVVQAGMCRHSGYRAVCCQTCLQQG